MIGTTAINDHTQGVLVGFTAAKQSFESFKLQQNKAFLFRKLAVISKQTPMGLLAKEKSILSSGSVRQRRLKTQLIF